MFNGKLDISLNNQLGSDQALVFCHSDVLRECISELLRNVDQHVVSDLANGDAIPD